MRVIDPRSHDVLFDVNALNQIVRETSREVTDGSGVRYQKDTFYDANDNVVRVDVQNIDESGTLQPNTHFTTTFEHDILNQTIRDTREVDEGVDLVTEYDYDANRNRTLVRNGEATNGNQPTNVERTLFDERDLVFQEVRADGDADQSTTQFDYDANGNNVVATRGIEGTTRVTANVFDGYDRLVSTTEPMGNVTSFHYDPNGNMGGFADAEETVQHPNGMRVDGELDDIEGQAGNVRLSQTWWRYDAMDRSVREEQHFFDTDTQADIQGGQELGAAITEYEWADHSQLLRLINDNLHEQVTMYDSANRVLSTTDAKGNSVTYAYDANSNVVTITEVEKSDLGDPDENFVTTGVFDNIDRRIETTDNVGNTHRIGYDSRDNKTMAIDASNNETRHVYDGVDRHVATIRDMDGDGAQSDDDADFVTIRLWDDSFRLIGQGDDNGNLTRFAFDALDRRIAKRMADGTIHQTGTGLTGADWPDGVDRPSLDGFLSGLDVHDNVVRSTDANGSVALSAFDLNNRLTNKAITPGPGVSEDTTLEQFAYDGLDRIVRAEDDDSIITRSYDSRSNVIDESRDGQATSCVYDGVDNLLSMTCPGGRQIDRTFDELERMSIVTDAGTNSTIAMFDFVGPGRVERRTFDNGTQTDFEYDGVLPNPPSDFGVKQVIRTLHRFDAGGPNEQVIDDRGFAWDCMLNKTQRVDLRTGGPELTHDYDYDATHRMVRSTRTPTAGQPTVIEYDLDGVGNRVTVTGPSQGAGGYDMDSLDPPSDHPVNQYTATPMDRREYDANGNLLVIATAGDFDIDGDIDLADLTEFTSCMTGPAGMALWPCRILDMDNDDDLDLEDFAELQNRFTGAGPGLPGALVTYDYRNRMVQFEDAATGQRHTYAYDALDRRIVKIEDADGVAGGPDETRLFYDGWQIVEEQDASGTTMATFVFGLFIDELLNMQRGAREYFFHVDDMYNVMAVTNRNGAAVERYEYDDYGRPDVFNGAGAQIAESAIGNPNLFTGRRFDEETGWYHYRTRYLDPAAGRFTSRDTIGTWGDPTNIGNAYAYVGNNPWSAVDPMGTDGKKKQPDPYTELAKDLVRRFGPRAEIKIGGKGRFDCCSDPRKKTNQLWSELISGAKRVGPYEVVEVTVKVRENGKLVEKKMTLVRDPKGKGANRLYHEPSPKEQKDIDAENNRKEEEQRKAEQQKKEEEQRRKDAEQAKNSPQQQSAGPRTDPNHCPPPKYPWPFGGDPYGGRGGKDYEPPSGKSPPVYW